MATIEGYSVNCLIDTGAAASCINSDFVKRKLGNCEIRPVSNFDESDLSFVTASGEKLNYDGYISANTTLPGYNEFSGIFLVIQGDHQYDHILLGSNILHLLHDDKKMVLLC